MRWLLLIAFLVTCLDTAGASGPVNRLPPKTPREIPPSIPLAKRQGGDTILDATPILHVPYLDHGTTAGYTNNYDEVCPYPTSLSPDVVYSLTPPWSQPFTFDLCGSSYDTKLYVYDNDLNLVACNDDYHMGELCGDYTSCLSGIMLQGGLTYYIVVDGYGSQSGDYIFEAYSWDCYCTLTCPAGSAVEGEPPLAENYVDNWNGGCNSPPDEPFQDIIGDAAGERVFCGVAGWYIFNGANYRDTDWYRLVMGPTGTIEVVASAERATYVGELGPQDCAMVGFVQLIQIDNCIEAPLTITGYEPGQVVWLWVGSTTFVEPFSGGPMYNYILEISGLWPGVVATTQTTWSELKSLYRH